MTNVKEMRDNISNEFISLFTNIPILIWFILFIFFIVIPLFIYLALIYEKKTGKYIISKKPLKPIRNKDIFVGNFIEYGFEEYNVYLSRVIDDNNIELTITPFLNTIPLSYCVVENNTIRLPHSRNEIIVEKINYKENKITISVNYNN